MSVRSTAPLWTLEGLRAADPVLGLALLMLAAVLIAELLHRHARLPRPCGHMLAGALASPLLLRLIDRADLDPWKPLIDLAIGALLFELGTRIRPRWLLDNPWLAASALLQSVLAGVAVGALLVALGAPPVSAAVAGAVAMATSPVIVLSAINELRSRGQVTERVLIITAVNSVLAVVALKVLRIVLASDGTTLGDEFVTALTSALRVVFGSLLLGLAAGWLLERSSRWVRGTAAMPVLQIGFVITASMLAAQWTLSPLLALLIAGVSARTRMGHALTVEPHLGSAGAALNVVLFLSLGLLFTIDGFLSLWPWVIAILLARLVAAGVAVTLLAPRAGLSYRQAGALALALQPMSGLAVLLAADTFGWTSQLPGADARVMQALLIAITLMQATGPIWTQASLRRLAGEAPGLGD
jgi:Kef-type K+ transport system membrane component KefB